MAVKDMRDRAARGRCPVCERGVGVQSNGKVGWHENKAGEECDGYTAGEEALPPPAGKLRERGKCPLCRMSTLLRVDGTMGPHRMGRRRIRPDGWCPAAGEFPEPRDAPAGADGEGYQA